MNTAGTKVITIALLAAFVLAFVLVSSTGPGVKLRGSSSGEDGILRDAQVVALFPEFLSFVPVWFWRTAEWILSLPTTLIQSAISFFYFVWDFLFGALVSVSSPFMTKTTTTTLAPVTSMPQTTTSMLTSLTMTSASLPQTTPISALTSLGSMTSSTGTSVMSSISTTPTVPSETTTASSSALAATTTVTTTSSSMMTTALPTTTTTTTGLPTTTTTTQLNTTTTTTPMPFKTVFVTSGMFNGSLGGLEGADLICSEAAMAGSLTGKFLPWLSNASHTPMLRFTKDTLPYIMIGGKRFVDNYATLVSSGPLNNLDIQEDGQMTPSSANQVWTGTAPNGDSLGSTCGDWTSTSGSANTGITTNRFDWSNGGFVACTTQLRLYCFEQ